MKKDRDILFMCQFFYPEYVSSATLPYDTAKRLTECGYKVGALCGYPKEYMRGEKVKKKENVGGIEINRLKYLQMKRVGKLGKLVNYFSFALAVFFNIFKAKRYKTIMVYSNPPLLPLFAVMAKKLFGCRLVFVSYDVYPEIAMAGGYTGKGGLIASGLSFVNRKNFKNADKVIAVSSDMADFLRNNRNILPEKVTDIPNWYEDEGAVKKAEASLKKTLFDCDEDDFIVSYFGNLGECQDEKVLLDVIERLKNDAKIKFVFAGHGTKFGSFKEAVAEKGYENVRILPFLHGDDYKNALALTDVFTATLIKGLCGLCSPSKVCACLMAGKPIITVMDAGSEIGSDVEKSNAGGRFDNCDGEKIAGFIKMLSQNPEKCNEMGNNARKLFLEKYEKNVCLERYCEVIKEVMSV